MARMRTETFRLGEREFSISTLTLGELGKIMPLFKRYFDTAGIAGLSADGAIDAAGELIAAAVGVAPEEVAQMPVEFGEIATAIATIGTVCGLEFATPGEAAAGTAQGMTGSTSAPSTPPSPPAADTDTSTSTA